MRKKCEAPSEAVKFGRSGLIRWKSATAIKRNVEGYLATRGPGRSEDGFLPLSVFDSIYVNNLENFLIPNPQRNR